MRLSDHWLVIMHSWQHDIFSAIDPLGHVVTSQPTGFLCITALLLNGLAYMCLAFQYMRIVSSQLHSTYLLPGQPYRNLHFCLVFVLI